MSSASASASALDWLVPLSAWLHPNLVITPGFLPSDQRGSDQEVEIQAGVAGVSVRSRGEINIGQTVARIPKRSVLSYSNSNLRSLPEWNPALDLSPTLRLVLVVLYEMHLGPQSRWSAYLRSLPQVGTVSVGVLWTGQAKRWARGSEVDRVVRGLGLDQTSLEKFYTSLPPQLVQSIGYPTRETFLRTYSLVSSRAFMVDAYHTVALVPLFDLFNHSDTPHVHVQAEHWVCSACGSFEVCSHDDEDEMDVETNGEPKSKVLVPLSSSTSDPTETETETENENETYELLSLVPIEPNEEVFNTYGDLTNAQLVAMYGFLIDGNQDDKVHFDLFSEVGGLEQEGRKELKELESIWRDLGLWEEDHEVITPLSPTEEPTTKSLHPNEDLYIDAEARLSTPLWLALLVTSEIPFPRSSRKRKGTFLQTFYTSLSSNLVNPALVPPLEKRNLTLFKSHLEAIVLRKLEHQHRPELTSQELLQLVEADGLDEMNRLAIHALAIERGLLETLVAKISEV